MSILMPSRPSAAPASIDAALARVRLPVAAIRRHLAEYPGATSPDIVRLCLATLEPAVVEAIRVEPVLRRRAVAEQFLASLHRCSKSAGLGQDVMGRWFLREDDPAIAADLAAGRPSIGARFHAETGILF